MIKRIQRICNFSISSRRKFSAFLTFTMIPKEPRKTLANHIVSVAFARASVLARIVGIAHIMF